MGNEEVMREKLIRGLQSGGNRTGAGFHINSYSLCKYIPSVPFELFQMP